MPPSLILASASPRRSQLLSRLGVAFAVEPARVTEHEAEDADPEHLVLHNADLKASWVAERHPDAFVLGADTTVFVDSTVLNKPADLADARRMLRLLSGRTHTVFTGLCLCCRNRGVHEISGVASRVTFRMLSDDAIEHYLSVVNPLDKAGAYGIQEHPEIIVDRFEGSHSNVMGLPLDETKVILTSHSLVPC